MSEITEAARHAAGDRSIFIVAENEWQEAKHVEPISEGGYGLDGVWNDELYGGSGTAMLNVEKWHLPGHAAILLEPAQA